MLNSVALSVGLRYAFSRHSAVSFISVVAVVGLALSVAVLVVVVSVINGFEREFRERVFGVLPHISFLGADPLSHTPADRAALEALPEVQAASAFVQGGGLAAVAKRATGVMITGIDPAEHAQVSKLQDFVVGHLPSRAGSFEVALGVGVARHLEVRPGDRVTLVLPTASITPAGLFPRQKQFVVSGLIESRSDLDAHAAYVHRGDAQRLFRLGTAVHGYQARLSDLFDANSAGQAGVTALGEDRVYARTWMRTHGNLYRAIGVQKSTMFVLLSLLIAVAAFNLVSTLVMVVDRRSADIAILRTMGGSGVVLVGVFVALGLTLGAVGIAAGALLGWGLAELLPVAYEWLAGQLDTDLMSEYFINYLPVEVRAADLVGIAGTAAVLCLASTLYPAFRVAALRPAEVLAHE